MSVKKGFNYLFLVNKSVVLVVVVVVVVVIIIIIIIIISQTGMFINTEICCRLVPVAGNIS